jgi:2',3'-cyclic-nucleotide 2'-phosphodiesterase/3'-nucleotidase
MAAIQLTAAVTILQTSDLHGSILPIHYANNEANEVGLAKIATRIAQERGDTPINTIVIDNGDLIQGTPLAYHHARINNEPYDPMVLCLNELQYDAAVLGNHEFNYGMDVLEKAIREARFPWLSANILHRETGLPYFGQPYVIRILEHGIRVAVLGLTTSYIPNWENPNHIRGLVFRDVVEAAQEWVRYVRETEKADIVVVSYHGGFECDLDTALPSEPQTGENQGYRLCMEVEGIDVLLTGHQHRNLAAQVNGVAIVQPGNQGRFLGKVSLRLSRNEDRWEITDKKPELLSVEGIEPDPIILGLVEDYEHQTQKWLDMPIGQLVGDMRITDPMAVRLREHALIEFINKVQMAYGGTTIANTALFDNDSLGFKTEITMRDVVSNYMYANTLKVVRVTGADIKAALEQTAGYFAHYDGEGVKVSKEFAAPKPQHYNYDMWEGIDYRINISRPLGERVTMLNYEGKPIDLEAGFDVAMNSYRAGGGGNYTMFHGKPVIKDIPTDVSELIASYIMEKGMIEAAVNGNWEVIWDEQK